MTPLERFKKLCETNPELASELLDAGEELARTIDSVDVNDGKGLGEVEDKVEKAVDELARKSMAAVLGKFSLDTAFVHMDGQLWRRVKEPTPCAYFTRRGEVTILRHLYRLHGVRNGPTIAPLEHAAGLVDGRWTPRAATLAAALLQNETAREAAQTCKRAGVMPYSAAALGRVTETVGTSWHDSRARIETQLMREFDLDKGVVAASVAADRVSIRIDEESGVFWRMAYCGVVTLHDAEGEAVHAIRYGFMPGESASYSLEDALRGDLAALLAKRPSLDVVVLSDGAPEMKLLLERVVEGIAPKAERALDLWHAVERIAEAAKAVKLDPKATTTDVTDMLKTRADGAAAVEALVKTWRRRARTKKARETVDEVIGYLRNNCDRMAYASLRSRNLPIGSGHVEATCKTLVSVRMKRAGARWSTQGGTAIIGLRSLDRSSRWDGAMKMLMARSVRKVTASARAS